MLELIVPGTRITGSDWNDIGVVKNIIINPDTARIIGLVVKINILEERDKFINSGVVSRLLDQGKFATLELTREEVEALPDFDRSKFIGMAELAGMANPIVYNQKSKTIILPPTNVYLYPLSENLKIIEGGKVNNFHLQTI